MQLPADSFAYTPLKNFRSVKGQDQMPEVRCQMSEASCQMSGLEVGFQVPKVGLTSHISHLLHAEVFHKRDAIDFMKR